ncbi:hypothetical protein [Streptomyces morookaense]|uniref:Uncharacterized protein n=1 Tax=Streptomyces morookaense TaxID=1970 RepID=A0A7Y7B6Q4_STRMO|nr:hypothetical protein [Streptomyces morookaense]NVK80063.1 hypothetical protein [Streptomyces morookaense]GHF46058.1 hypothetical protein GCM10010359_55650 [Streptomyces morookaense]
MQPPHFSVTVWWVVAIAVTVFFLVFMVTLMPTPKGKRSVCVVPVAGAAYVVADAVAPGGSLDTSLPAYAVGLFAIPMMFVGHRKRVRWAALDGERNGEMPGNRKFGALMAVQVVVVVLTAYALGFWLIM